MIIIIIIISIIIIIIIIFITDQLQTVHLRPNNTQGQGKFGMKKLKSRITFPLELDVRKYCVPNVGRQTSCTYHLAGIIVHGGSKNSS